MTEEDLAPADDLRLAICGARNERVSRFAAVDLAHVLADDADRQDSIRAAETRCVEDLLGRVADSRTPDRMAAWLRAAVAQKSETAAAELDVTWIQASVLHPWAPVRGHDREWYFGTGTARWTLLAELSPLDGGRWVCSGKVTEGSQKIPAAGRTVTLFVDGKDRGSVVSDAFGEFSFDAVAGMKWSLRVDYGCETAHVALTDLSRQQPGATPQP